ncbi:orotidine-5'-phosphate decarboxylase [Roseomonas elaeocarpi]|uniref:Orotidine 5'-phosphate decarboxylase n=1 Tax=Roseomonas elaeocarpi TaxID=907779 RepID=A0ABV6JW79_9PROT
MPLIARPQSGRQQLIVAVDTADPAAARQLCTRLAPEAGLLKLGLEFFVANGPAAIRAVAGEAPVFLDLKFHDIPNTVAGAVRSACAAVRPAMLTVHASGGAPMIRAAREAAEAAGGDRPAVLAVTVLTSLDAATLSETGVAGGPAQQVLRLARIALDAGADGLVCSPHEVSRLRDAFGEAPMLVVPGVRPRGAAAGDQARTATPAEAIAAGADWIVMGRPITGHADPVAAARAAVAEMPR